MSNDDLLCGAPGPGGNTCTLPYGHGGDAHAFEVEVPPSIGRLLDDYMEQLDQEKARYRHWAKWERRSTFANIGLLLVWVGLLIARGLGSI